MAKRKTAGELCLKAAGDTTRYDPLEVAHGLTDDVIGQVLECAQKHSSIMGEDEFFVCLFVAGDPLLANVRRHKYAAFLYLPSPRPNQACFMYNKVTNKLVRLWSLPGPKQMALISSQPFVEKKWRSTKKWCDSFFNFTFWQDIRKEHKIEHLSEYEWLQRHREEIVQPGVQDIKPCIAEPFDFSKVTIDHITDTKTARPDEDALDSCGQTQSLHGNIRS